eukprot:830069-Prymnesium_polylepis.1
MPADCASAIARTQGRHIDCLGAISGSNCKSLRRSIAVRPDVPHPLDNPGGCPALDHFLLSLCCALGGFVCLPHVLQRAHVMAQSRAPCRVADKNILLSASSLASRLSALNAARFAASLDLATCGCICRIVFHSVCEKY